MHLADYILSIDLTNHTPHISLTSEVSPFLTLCFAFFQNPRVQQFLYSPSGCFRVFFPPISGLNLFLVLFQCSVSTFGFLGA